MKLRGVLLMFVGLPREEEDRQGQEQTDTREEPAIEDRDSLEKQAREEPTCARTESSYHGSDRTHGRTNSTRNLLLQIRLRQGIPRTSGDFVEAEEKDDQQRTNLLCHEQHQHTSQQLYDEEQNHFGRFVLLQQQTHSMRAQEKAEGHPQPNEKNGLNPEFLFEIERPLLIHRLQRKES